MVDQSAMEQIMNPHKTCRHNLLKINCPTCQIEKTVQEIAKQKERVNLMWKFLATESMLSNGQYIKYVDKFIRLHPEAADWFDEEGVPR